jgi:Ser/Thr protein kinase RdoA (MazF antagonist)
MSMNELKQIFAQFQLCGDVVSFERFGSGNINDTYRSVVQSSSPVFYIHQKINQKVFPHPEYIMANMACVTSHIQQKLQQEYAPNRKTTLELIPTKDGALYYRDPSGEYWRTTTFIPNTMVYDVVQNLEHAYQAGKMLGEFQKLVADIPPAQLHDTLPGFHHTPRYYAQFLDALDTVHPDHAIEARKRALDVAELIKQARQREALAPLLMNPYQTGILCPRIVHNDPKVNNILVDIHTCQGICLIDLDTVKSGLVQFDYGDCLRSAANPAGEEIRDLRQVRFDLEIFEWITKGYLEEARTFLSAADLDYLVDSIKVIILEQLIRFLTDYLKGDVYYKISYPTQNFNRANVQFALLKDLEAKEAEARTILTSLSRES